MLIIRKRTAVIVPKSTETQFHDSIKFQDDSITLPPIPNQRQDKYTVPIDKLPVKWRSVIGNCQLFRLQYSVEQAYDRSVLGDYLQDGLNLNLIPAFHSELSPESKFDDVLEFVSREFNEIAGTNTTAESFILTPTAVKYFQDSIDTTVLSELVDSLTDEPIDPHWSSFQLDYSEKDVVIEVYWDNYTKEDPIRVSPGVKHEIGVFSVDEKLTNIDNVALNGVRFVESEDKTKFEAKKTSFQFIPRHREIPDVKFDVSRSPDSALGLHPSFELVLNNETQIQPPLVLNVDDEEASSEEEQLGQMDICKMYAVWNIPNNLFLDRYQLDDDKFKAKGVNLLALFGEANLELPDYSMANWGTEALIELDPGKAAHFEFPFHSRYSLPNGNGTIEASLQSPIVFWACDLKLPIQILEQLGSGYLEKGLPNPYSRQISQFESDLEVLSHAPFHRKFLDYESYFDDNTVFYHIMRNSSEPKLSFGIPTGQIDDHDRIQYSTIVILVLSCLYLVRKLFG